MPTLRRAFSFLTTPAAPSAPTTTPAANAAACVLERVGCGDEDGEGEEASAAEHDDEPSLD